MRLGNLRDPVAVCFLKRLVGSPEAGLERRGPGHKDSRFEVLQSSWCAMRTTETQVGIKEMEEKGLIRGHLKAHPTNFKPD
jgi:hypothetical protein